jgi:hypothetical protein
LSGACRIQARAAVSAGKLLGYGAVVSLLLLAACQHDGSNRPTVSLEEAKQITAEFSDGSFVPPPRSISDIIKLLDEQP